ncbi:MAG: hypothetical protein CMJ49_13765 [Planctomycetaceae bacterium]|nr:hypothetical protein [Planctomycetaceae bacterium]
MSQTPYQRVDPNQADQSRRPDATPDDPHLPRVPNQHLRIRWAILPLGIILCIAQAVFTIVAENQLAAIVTSTLIPVIAFALLFACVLVINPLLRLIFRGVILRPFSRAELMTLFAVLLVTCGISTFGLTSQLIPIIGAPFNPQWNTAQRGWSEELLPHINPQLYLTVSPDATLDEKTDAVNALKSLWSDDDAGDHGPAVTHLINVLTDDSTYVVPEKIAAHRAHLRSALTGAADRRLQQFDEAATTLDTVVAHRISTQNMTAFHEGVSKTSDGRPITKPPEGAPFAERYAHWKKVAAAIPWDAWAKPLAYWAIFILASYGLFYSLTHIVMGYWSRREKLIFPLAQLPEAILPDADDAGSWVPRIFKTTGFWAGFAASFFVLTWNAAVSFKWLTLGAFPLGLPGNTVNKIVANTGLAGLGGGLEYNLAFLVIFTAVGVAFLLPLEISFSTWFYWLAGKCVVLALVWMGYGTNMADFHTDWLWMNNPMSGMGAGGIIVFSAISLYRSLREYFRLGAGRSAAQRWRLALPVIALVICLGVLIGWICWNWQATGNPLSLSQVLWAFLFVLVTTLLSLGLMRIVAEGGIYWIQAHASFFHLFKVFGLGKVMSTAMLAPLLPIYSVLFLDIKTFMAPNMLNAEKMRENIGGSRAKFHINIVTCLLVTLVVAIGFTVFFAHLRGGRDMQEWFYKTGPLTTIDTAYRAVTDTPEVDGVTAGWYGVGAGWVGLTIFLRRALFWFPHPIGFLMMINPLMTYLWFSFFIGWLCKKLVVKYGGKATFDRVRVIFIGLILGELIGVFVWPTVAMILGQTMNAVTLNRY